MEIRDKQNFFNTYIDKELGRSTYETIDFFNRNANYMNQYLQLQYVLTKNIDHTDGRGIDLSNFDSHTKMILKQFIIVGMISNLQNLIEGMLVLIYTLSLGYIDVNKNMIYYNYDLLDCSIKKIKKKNLNFRKLLGYCDLNNLDLNSDEKKILNQIYTFSINTIHSMLLDIIKFYQTFRIPHEKFKHGLNFVPGLITNYDSKSEFDLEHSTMNFRSKKEDHKLNDFAKAQSFDDNPNHNIITILHFNDNLETKIKTTLNQVTKIITYTCSNHKIHAINCGMDYLPFNIEEFIKRGKDQPLAIPIYFFVNKDQLKEIDTTFLMKIYDKIIPKINYDIPAMSYRDYFIDKSNSINKDEPIWNIQIG